MTNLEKIILGRRGGKSTAKIIELLFKRPYNTNQISKILDTDYNKVSYHVQILIKNNIATKDDEYGALILLNEQIKNQEDEFEKILRMLYDK